MRILIVEDEPKTGRYLQKGLTEAGFVVDWVGDGALVLADLGYEGEPGLFRIPVKKPAGGASTVDQQAYNAIHSALRCLGERANSLLKTTYKALRHYRGCPWRLGDIVGAALVLLHRENRRTT